MKSIYLDHAASTPLSAKALKTLCVSYEEDFANPNASHRAGRRLDHLINEAKSYFLKILESEVPIENSKFLFTSSATEANNILLQGLFQSFSAHDLVLLSSADHPSLSWPLLEKGKSPPYAFQKKEIPFLPGGSFDGESFEKILYEHPSLIALSHVNNHSGAEIPIEKIGNLIKKISPKTHFHVDASQSFTKTSNVLSIKKDKIDSLTLSAHKMGGPKGVAGLFLSSRVRPFKPLFFGGGQEFGLRSSTQATPLIFSFKQACEEALLDQKTRLKKVLELNVGLRCLLRKKFSDSVIFLNELSPKKNEDTFSPYILSFIIPHFSSDILIRLLEEKNIFVSSTSACSSKIKGLNRAFSALHIPPQFHKNVLRVSFSYLNSQEDVYEFSKALEQIVIDLKSLKLN